LGSRFFTTEALVIGSMRYREADRIVTLYTRERGRLGAIAKGVRRTSSKVGGRLEPFGLIRASLHTGHGLYTVVGVETLRTFQGVRDELFRMEEGARLFAAVRHLFPAEEGSVPAFNVLVRGIACLAESPNPATAASLVLATRLKLLVLLGYAPETSRCAGCGGEGSVYGFSPALGGVVCETCAGIGAGSAGVGARGGAGVSVDPGTSRGAEAFGGPSCFPLSAGAVATLRTFLDKPLAEVESYDFDERAVAEVEQVLIQTLAHHGH
jgi:DNA repair protein RecO (recombination protein O)